MSRWSWWVLAIPALLATPSPGQGMPPALVEVAEVVQREVRMGRSFVGTVASPQQAVVGSEVSGLVVELLARKGSRVSKGDVLARLRARTLEIQIEAARATLDLRDQELRELENGTRPEEIAQARARVGQARAVLELSRWKAASALKAHERNSISDIELMEAQLPEKGAEQRLAEMEAALDLAVAGPRKERIAQARARVATAQADVDRLSDDLDRHAIRAPFDAYVLAERTEVGQWLGVGAPVVELASLREVEVTLPVIEDYISEIRVGRKVKVTFEALEGREFDGTVVAVVPFADVRARTFPVKISVVNEEAGGTPLLKVGMMARTSMAVGHKKMSLLVPLDALVLGGPMGTVVYTVDQEGAARLVPVKTGLPFDGLIQVEGPLQPGAKVVVKGNERLFPGQPVRIAGS